MAENLEETVVVNDETVQAEAAAQAEADRIIEETRVAEEARVQHLALIAEQKPRALFLIEAQDLHSVLAPIALHELARLEPEAVEQARAEYAAEKAKQEEARRETIDVPVPRKPSKRRR